IAARARSLAAWLRAVGRPEGRDVRRPGRVPDDVAAEREPFVGARRRRDVLGLGRRRDRAVDGEVARGDAHRDHPGGRRDVRGALRGALRAAARDDRAGPFPRRQDLARGLRNVRKLEEEIRGEFQRLREREEEASALRAVLQEKSFQKERLATRRQELERIAEESGIERQDLQSGETPFLAMATEEIKRHIERVRARLEEIGGIDQAVLKEYRDTRTRHEFLEREIEDLSSAKKNLDELIGELEERMERDFKEGFARIKSEFHRYFRIIFGGGQGTIAVVPLRRATAEAEDESADEGEIKYGIDIDVDLPRKRIKGLAMLSGGERALVSIALLFAITAVNPPPFLVLDETDAALDEANSQKYAAILKELAKKTQLILITHNRETMKQAGVLYGVTMGDDGISKILSLKLEEAESYGNR
ncbi:MAG: hypothetical protein AAB650_02605, partial [Patescibacteria group bacterium]